MKKKILLAIVGLVALSVGVWCWGQSGNHSPLKEGDIVFCISQSPQSPVIASVTGSPWTHCGVIVMKNGEPWVLEAVQPVKLTRWTDWKQRSKGGITSMKRYTEDEVKISYGKYLGKSYDLAFRFGNNKWYCSELVYDIYKTQLGVELCQPHPVSDYHPSDKAKKEMKRRGITADQLVVAPVDLFNSDKLH